jgi:hypothetical protein
MNITSVSTERRALLISRLWLSYLSFVTGMILALVGAAFILGQLEFTEAGVTTKIAGSELSLQSTSPGLILAGLGVAMMMVTTVTLRDWS